VSRDNQNNALLAIMKSNLLIFNLQASAVHFSTIHTGIARKVVSIWLT